MTQRLSCIAWEVFFLGTVRASPNHLVACCSYCACATAEDVVGAGRCETDPASLFGNGQTGLCESQGLSPSPVGSCEASAHAVLPCSAATCAGTLRYGFLPVGMHSSQIQAAACEGVDAICRHLLVCYTVYVWLVAQTLADIREFEWVLGRFCFWLTWVAMPLQAR